MITALLSLWLATGPAAPMSEAQRKAHVATMSREELEAFLTSTPPDVLLALSNQAVMSLGPYSYLMAKSERINGRMQQTQTIRVSIREEPMAIRLEYLKGPAAGRKIVFNSAVKRDEFRVREPGFLSIVGKLWIPMNSPVTKDDSNRTVAEAGLGNLVRRLQKDHSRAGAGLRVQHEGWNDLGHFCTLYTLPNGGRGFDNAQTRICTDALAGIPSKVEGFDAAGALLERYEFSDLKPLTPTDATWDPETGL
jgi:hypothetical protein